MKDKSDPNQKCVEPVDSCDIVKLNILTNDKEDMILAMPPKVAITIKSKKKNFCLRWRNLMQK